MNVSRCETLATLSGPGGVAHPGAPGLRWWSTLEASWINVTLFDRAAGLLRVRRVRPLTQRDEEVVAAARFLGLGA